MYLLSFYFLLDIFVWKADAMHHLIVLSNWTEQVTTPACHAGKNIESRPAEQKVFILWDTSMCTVPAKHLFQQHLNIHIID